MNSTEDLRLEIAKRCEELIRLIRANDTLPDPEGDNPERLDGSTTPHDVCTARNLVRLASMIIDSGLKEELKMQVQHCWTLLEEMGL